MGPKDRIAIRPNRPRCSEIGHPPAMGDRRTMKIRDELHELCDTIRLFVHTQRPDVPGGFSGIVESLRGEFLVT
jgi:hypothetical protein